MKLDLDKSFDGILLTGGQDVLLTGRKALDLALNHIGERDIPAQDKFDRFKLLKRLDDANGSLEVSAEDLVKLKQVTGSFPFSVQALGRVWEWLDG